VLLCAIFTKLNNVPMKKLATLLFAFNAVFSIGVYAQSRSVVALRPTENVLLAPQNASLSDPGFPASYGHNGILSMYDSLSYIDSVTNPLRYANAPGFINFIQSDQSRFLDTIISYSEHFQPSFVSYLDGVSISIALANLVQSTTDSINKNALTIRIKTTNTIGPKALDTAIFTYDQLTAIDPGTDPNGGHPFFLLNVPLHHKRVGKSFYVENAPALDYVNGLATATQNFFGIQQDSVFYSGGLPATARSSMVALHGGSPTGKTPAAYTYALIDPAGNNFYSNFYIVAYITDQASGVADTKLSGNALAQNYPNAFNSSTEIKYSLANEGRVSLKVYNALGLEVATLANDFETAGEHQLSFNGENLPSGTYFYMLRSGAFSETKRMVIAK
jgi:hypothetical protein